MNTSVSSIDGPGWYLISSSSNGSFVDVIKNYATQNYPQAKYKIYNIAFAIPTGWTEDEGNATFKNKDWNKIDNINDPSVIMEASLGYWVKILSYNSNIVTNQSQLIIGCTAGFIAISNDGKGWQNLNELGGTSFGPLPSEVPNNALPYFSSFLFEGKAYGSPTISESLYVSSIKNIVPTDPNGSYKSEIYEIFNDNSVSTSPINSIQDAFIYNIHNLLTPNNNNYYWLLSGYSNRFVKSNPTPFYNTTHNPKTLTQTSYNVDGTDWTNLNTSSFPLWASTNIKNPLNSYLPGEYSEGNYIYYINDDIGVHQWFPFNVNNALITSVDTNGQSYYIVGANGYYFEPVISNDTLTLQVNQVSSAIYYVDTSIFDDFSTIQENTSNNTKTPWLSAFSYNVNGPYQIYPKVAYASFPDVNSIHNLVEGVINNTKYVFAIQRSNDISTVYNDGVVDVSTFSDTNLDGTCVLCYCALDTLATNAGNWSTSDSVSINNVLTVDNINIVYIQNLFYVEDKNTTAPNGTWYLSCLDNNSSCVLLKSTTPTDMKSWTIAYDSTTQSLFPISPTSFTNPQDQAQTIPLYYQVKDIVQNEDQEQSTFLISITGNELAITVPNSENTTNPVGTYYANINTDKQFTNINESIPDVPRSNTFNSILKRDVKDIVYEIKNNESQTIIPSYISLGYAVNVLAIAGGGSSGSSGSIDADTNNNTRSIINYSGSGAGGAAASLIYATANDLVIRIDDKHNINLDFGTDGMANLISGDSGVSNDVDFVAQGGTYNKTFADPTDPDSPNQYLQYDLLTNGFANGFNGLAQKTIVYNDTQEKAQENAAKYSPDGGDGGIVTADLDGNNYYGIGGSGTFNSIQNDGGNAYVLVRYVKWTGAIPDPVNTAAFSVAIYNSINDQTVQSYRDYVIPTDPSQYPMLIYLNEFAPKAGEEASGRILFNYPLVEDATANLVLSGGAGGGGGGAASNSTEDNTYYDVPNSIIDNGKAITGPTPGWSGRGAYGVLVPQNTLVVSDNTNITDYVYKLTVGGGGKGGKKYSIDETESLLNGGNGITTELNIYKRNSGSDDTPTGPYSAEGGAGGLNGYYSNSLPDNYDLTKTGAPYGSRGNYAPNAALNLQGKITGLNESYNYPGGVIVEDQLLTQLGGDGGGGTSNGIGAGGGYGNGGLPGLYSNANEGGIHGYYGGGGGGGMGGKNMASDGGNGSSGMAFLYLTGPPDYNQQPQLPQLMNTSDQLDVQLTQFGDPTSVKSIILAKDFTMPSGYSFFNFAIYGAGGNGAQTNSDLGIYSGGGSGAFIHAKNIPYELNGSIIKEISYDIGAGGQDETATSVYITYTDNNMITLQSGAGKSALSFETPDGPFPTSAGGVANVINNTAWDDSMNNLIQADGASGGDRGTVAQSNDYTSPGAGGNDEQPNDAATGVSTDFIGDDGKKYTISSQGGGLNTTVSGYGAGGAATPANYENNAYAYEIGTPGCIVYYLSGDVAPEPEPEGEPVGPPDIVVYNATVDSTTGEYNYDSNDIYKTLSLSNQSQIAKAPFDFDSVSSTSTVYYVIQFNATYSSNIGFILIGPGGSGGNVLNDNDDGGSTDNNTGAGAGGGGGGWSQIEFNKAVATKDTKFYINWDGSNWFLRDNTTLDNSTWEIWAGPGSNGESTSMKTKDATPKGGLGGVGGMHKSDGSYSRVSWLEESDRTNGADGVPLNPGSILGNNGKTGQTIYTLYSWSESHIQLGPGSGAGGGKGGKEGEGGEGFTDTNNKKGGDGEGAGNGGGGAYKNIQAGDAGEPGGAGKVGGLMIYYNTGS